MRPVAVQQEQAPTAHESMPRSKTWSRPSEFETLNLYGRLMNTPSIWTYFVDLLRGYRTVSLLATDSSLPGKPPPPTLRRSEPHRPWPFCSPSSRMQSLQGTPDVRYNEIPRGKKRETEVLRTEEQGYPMPFLSWAQDAAGDSIFYRECIYGDPVCLPIL